MNFSISEKIAWQFGIGLLDIECGTNHEQSIAARAALRLRRVRVDFVMRRLGPSASWVRSCACPPRADLAADGPGRCFSSGFRLAVWLASRYCERDIFVSVAVACAP